MGVKSRPPLTTRVLQTLDTDLDGILSSAEIASSPASLITLDRNSNGELSLEEMGGPGPVAGMLRNQPVIRILDADGNLQLSAQEIERAPNALLRLDRDNNGELSPSDLTFEKPVDPGYTAIPARLKILMNEYVHQLSGNVLPGADPRVSEGYLMIQETSSFNDVQMGRHTYLLNNNAQIVHAWLNPQNAPESSSAHLLPNGLLLRTVADSDWIYREQYPTGAHGTLELVDYEGNRLWSYRMDQPGRNVLHHDFEPLPDGNILVTAYVGFTVEEAVEIGFDPALANGEIVWFESLIELALDPEQKSAHLAWQWNSWDHIVQDEFPDKPNFGEIHKNRDRIDVNAASLASLPFNAGEIHHINSIDYNPELDQILLSSAATGEIWVVDHSTSRAEAATDTGGASGKGGRLLYRWGNPQITGSTSSPRTLFWQRDAQWVTHQDKPGVLLYNTGLRRAADGSYNPDQLILGVDAAYTDLLEITLPVDDSGAYHLDQAPRITWSWNADGGEDFYSPFSGGISRLPNGHTLVVQSYNKRIIELTPEGERVLDFIIPGPGNIFKIEKLPPGHTGLAPLLSNQ